MSGGKRGGHTCGIKHKNRSSVVPLSALVVARRTSVADRRTSVVASSWLYRGSSGVVLQGSWHRREQSCRYRAFVGQESCRLKYDTIKTVHD